MRRLAALLLALSLSPIVGGASGSAAVLVAQCIESAPCYTQSTPWSYTLSADELSSLGLGTTQPFTAVQTSPFNIRLDETTISFGISNSVIQIIPEFNGPRDETLPFGSFLVASVFIPPDALFAIISGTFGNSTIPHSSGVDLFIGAVPLPAALPLFATGLGALGLLTWRRKRKQTAA
jgi:hypothetical protein